MHFTKETAKRAGRTFLQALVGSLCVTLPSVDWTAGKDVLKGVLASALISAIAAGISAAMNLQGAVE